MEGGSWSTGSHFKNSLPHSEALNNTTPLTPSLPFFPSWEATSFFLWLKIGGKAKTYQWCLDEESNKSWQTDRLVKCLSVLLSVILVFTSTLSCLHSVLVSLMLSWLQHWAFSFQKSKKWVWSVVVAVVVCVCVCGGLFPHPGPIFFFCKCFGWKVFSCETEKRAATTTEEEEGRTLNLSCEQRSPDHHSLCVCGREGKRPRLMLICIKEICWIVEPALREFHRQNEKDQRKPKGQRVPIKGEPQECDVQIVFSLKYNRVVEVRERSSLGASLTLLQSRINCTLPAYTRQLWLLQLSFYYLLLLNFRLHLYTYISSIVIWTYFRWMLCSREAVNMVKSRLARPRPLLHPTFCYNSAYPCSLLPILCVDGVLFTGKSTGHMTKVHHVRSLVNARNLPSALKPFFLALFPSFYVMLPVAYCNSRILCNS